MISIVRTATLNALRADSAALETTREKLTSAQTEAATATDSATRAQTLAEQQLRQLAQAHADCIQAERDRDAARKERDQALETARQEAQQQLAEIRAEVEQIRRDAADTETGETMRAALAYRMFQRLYADARAQGLEAKPPVDLVALILGLDAEPVPVDHPGATVPEDRRCWSVSWPGYAPVEITPPELRPLALAQHVPGWAEGHATPDLVRDWEQRQAHALVPFEFDERGWPLHPHGRTGRTGRNLGKWGENAAADPIVVAGTGEQRWVLLITRDDIGVEAIPGGMVDPGETAPAALVRELREETGIDLTDHQPTILGRQVVDDWRNTDHAWVASTSALYQLPEQVTATAGDDAADAGWFPFGSLDHLEAAITAAGRTLYPAHRPLLQRALEYLNQQS